MGNYKSRLAEQLRDQVRSRSEQYVAQQTPNTGRSSSLRPITLDAEPTWDVSEQKWAQQMNAFLERSVDNVGQSMDKLIPGMGWKPTGDFTQQEGDTLTYGVKLHTDIKVGDNTILVERMSDDDIDLWLLTEDNNRVGLISPLDGQLLDGSSLPPLEYTETKETESEDGKTIISLTLTQPVRQDYIRDFLRVEATMTSEAIENIPSEDLRIETNAAVRIDRCRRWSSISMDLQAIDPYLDWADNAADDLTKAVDSVLESNVLSVACCMLRQLAAIGSTQAEGAQAIAGHLTPREQAEEKLQEIRQFVIYARVLLSLTADLGTRGDWMNFLAINPSKMLIDSMLISLSATMNAFYRRVKDEIYSIAFGLLQRNRIVECMPFYDLVRGMLAWLFSRKGLMGWLASITFQATTRARLFFQTDIADFQAQIGSQAKFESLVRFLDSLIAATSNMELCQDILNQYDTDTPKEGDITKYEAPGGTPPLSGGTPPLGRTGAPEAPPPAAPPSDNPEDPSGTDALEDTDAILNNIFNPPTQPSGGPDTGVSDIDVMGAEALNLVINPSKQELEQFMINRLGADPAAARDIVYDEKLGECGKGLNSAEMSDVIQALHQAGIEV